MFDKHANLKYKFGNRHFWAEGHYVSTVGLNESTIRKYIEDQEKHDIALDKLSVKEYEDPFKGGKSGKGNRLEQSESQRLESLAGNFGLLALVQTTRLTGGYDLLFLHERRAACSTVFRA